MATAGIVVIGDEILSGKFVDENAAFLIVELRKLGVDLRRISIIPDDLDDIADTVPRLAARFDYLFTSGGVGPTHDDLTIAGIAQGFGVPVQAHPELLAKIVAHFGDSLAPANLRLADIPAGAELVYGADPSWPALALRNVYIFPGVPSLFRKKFGQVSGRLTTATVLVERLTFLCDEGLLAPYLDAIVAEFPDVKLGSYPRFDDPPRRVIITFEGPLGDRVVAAKVALVARMNGCAQIVE